MRQFAQIINGHAHWLFSSEERPQFDDTIKLIDITDLESMPQEGWLFDGSVFLPPEMPAATAQTPQQCTPAQGLVALYALKQIAEDDVLTAISQIADPVAQYTARIGYQRATTWERGSPTMQAMAQLLQLSASDLDELFAYAVGVAV